MINSKMRFYNYFTIGENNSYGQPQMPAADAEPEGQVLMSIFTSSQSTQDNVNYKDCNYIGLTLNATVNDTYIIEFGNERLKVLYVNNEGRLKQVFMKQI